MVSRFTLRTCNLVPDAHSGTVSSIRLTGSQEWVVSMSVNGSMRLWETAKLLEAEPESPPTKPSIATAIARWFGLDRSSRDREKVEVPHIIPCDAQRVDEAKYLCNNSQADDVLVTASTDSLVFLEVRDTRLKKTRIEKLDSPPIRDGRFDTTSNGQTIVTAHAGRDEESIRVCRADGTCIREFESPPPQAVAISRCGRFIAASSDYPQHVTLWDIDAGLLFEHSSNSRVDALAFSRSGTHLFAGNTDGQLLKLRFDNDADHSFSQLAWTPGWLTQIEVCEEHNLVFTVGSDKRLAVWDFETGRLLGDQVFSTLQVTALAVTADCRHVFIGTIDGGIAAVEVSDSGAVRSNAPTVEQEFEWDFFISHASEDKLQIAEPLAEQIRKRGYKVWYDRFNLSLGDDLRERIDDGLRSSRFGVVVLSQAFFQKNWPAYELANLVELESLNKRILPVWHDVTEKEVESYSDALAGRAAASTHTGLDSVANQIIQAVTSGSVDFSLLIEVASDGEFVGGTEALRTVVAEAYLARGSSIENLPPLNIRLVESESLQAEFEHSETSPGRRLELKQKIDRLNEAESRLQKSSSLILKYFAIREFDTEKAVRSILGLFELELRPKLSEQGVKKFDLWIRPPYLNASIYLDASERQDFGEKVDWDFEGPFIPMTWFCIDLPEDIFVDKAIPAIIREISSIQNAEKVSALDDAKLLDLISWGVGCG